MNGDFFLGVRLNKETINYCNKCGSLSIVHYGTFYDEYYINERIDTEYSGYDGAYCTLCDSEDIKAVDIDYSIFKKIKPILDELQSQLEGGNSEAGEKIKRLLKEAEKGQMSDELMAEIIALNIKE